MTYRTGLGLRARIKAAMGAIRENIHMARMGMGIRQQAHYLECEVEWEISHNVPGTRLNHLGCLLWSLGLEAKFYWSMAELVFFDRPPEWWEMDQ